MRRVLCLSVFLLVAISVITADAAIIDTYIEDFDDRQDDATINGVDSWSVEQGETSNAITQDTTTYTGSGKSLELIGVETAVNVSRSATYGDLSPSWIEFIVKPGIGAEARDVPSGKIAAVSFDYRGKIYAASGSSWVDTGQTFTAGEWYRVILRLDFKTHLYNIYIEPVANPEMQFIADKENLEFIDSSIGSLSQLGFEGVYNPGRTDDSYVDNLIVHFIDRLEIITASQTLVQDKPSTPITVQLQDSYSGPQTAWRDITLELRSSSKKGEFSLGSDEWKPISQVVIAENAQAVSFYYKDSKQGEPIITVMEYPDRGWEEAIQQVKIISRAVYFDVLVNTPQVAGEYFNVKIVARDDKGKINKFYTGQIEIFANYISPDTGTLQIAPDNASGFKKGRLELALVYPDCGIVEIGVQDKDEPSRMGCSGEVLFIPASFSVQLESPQVVSRAFQLEAAALNTQGMPAPNYQGPAALSQVYVTPEVVFDGEIAPAIINVGQFHNGWASISAKYNRWGIIKIEAHDEAYPAKSGLSNTVSFVPSGLLIEVESAPSERDFFYTGETFEILISLVDAINCPIPNYEGRIDISSTLGLDLPDDYRFEDIDEGRKTFLGTVDTPGFYTVEAEDVESDLEGKSPQIQVKRANLEVISTFAPVGTTEVRVELKDDEGNIITSENELTIQVSLKEEYDDSSASSPAVQHSVTFKKGVAKILVSNTQTEVVTITPAAQYDFKIRKGTVTFGRIAKTGIGTLMWREIKD